MTTTTNTMASPILARLQATIEAKTEQSLADLLTLDARISETLAEAEQAAAERLSLALMQVEEALARRLAGFEVRLGEMAAVAFQAALDGLEGRVDALAADLVEEPTTEAATIEVPTDPPSGERTVTETADEVPTIETAEEPMAEVPTIETVEVPTACEEPMTEEPSIESPTIEVPTQELAAQNLDRGDLAVLDPDDNGDEDAAGEDGHDDTALGGRDVPYVYDSDGLHTREKAGRRAKYHPVENPRSGEVYYRRDSRRRHWNPVIYVALNRPAASTAEVKAIA